MGGASRTVTIIVVGDPSSAKRAFEDVAKHADDSAEGMKTAFGGALGILNKSDLLEPFADSLDMIGDKAGEVFSRAAFQAGNLHKTLGLLGGVGLGLGAGLAMVGAGGKEAHEQLSAALEAGGTSFAEWSEEIEGVIKHNEQLAFGSTDTEKALARLYEGTQDVTKSTALMGLATKLARAETVDLTTASVQTLDIYEGRGQKTLKKFGIEMANSAEAQKTLKTAQTAAASTSERLLLLQERQHEKARLGAADHEELRQATEKATKASNDLAQAQQAAAAAGADGMGVIDELTQRLNGQDTAAVKGYTGHLRVLKTEVMDNVEAFGQKWSPAISILGTGMSIVSAGLEIAAARARRAAAAALEAEAPTLALADADARLAITANSAADAEYRLALAISGGDKALAERSIALGGAEAGGAAAGAGKGGGGRGILAAAGPIGGAVLASDVISQTKPGHKWAKLMPGSGIGIAGWVENRLHHSADPAGMPDDAIVPATGAPLGAGGDLTVHTHLNIDGAEVARAPATHTRDELLRQGRGMPDIGLG